MLSVFRRGARVTKSGPPSIFVSSSIRTVESRVCGRIREEVAPRYDQDYNILCIGRASCFVRDRVIRSLCITTLVCTYHLPASQHADPEWISKADAWKGNIAPSALLCSSASRPQTSSVQSWCDCASILFAAKICLRRPRMSTNPCATMPGRQPVALAACMAHPGRLSTTLPLPSCGAAHNALLTGNNHGDRVAWASQAIELGQK